MASRPIPAIPVAVLVNGGSASASEIVAGALHDTGRAKLVGETTYGKGTVQQWHLLSGDAGGFRLSIAKWLTPDQHWIHGVGHHARRASCRPGRHATGPGPPQLERRCRSSLPAPAHHRTTSSASASAIRSLAASHRQRPRVAPRPGHSVDVTPGEPCGPDRRPDTPLAIP